KAVFNFATM
nr:Chain C, Glycoprotein 9-residue peptide [synthetic construct]1S7T_F Chain F, Glycoprotein 9-residue peptide [synthetic construct]1S7X_C Chain C, Glycoprotein 9-residue peptide [synthetic construct]1S7X_F Chain F, Glycoprotein 9-residue peptide [synthetic construct]1S7X_I Chain I, Glycoprotein 9-residue peptide [synthetic construct]1S7X_L Chain L, Glycoprotein 9-residue peptide [synthetic construct]